MITKEILRLDGDKVRITEEGMIFQEFKTLYSNDKDPQKKFFKDVIKGIFVIYSSNSPLPTTSWTYEELVNALEKQWLDRKWSKLENNPTVIACIDLYKRLTKDKVRDSLRKVLADINEFMDVVEEIPSKIEQRIEVEVTDPDTKETFKKKIKVEVPNMEEKMRSYDNMIKLEDMYERYNRKIQESDGATQKGKKLFETKDDVPNDVITYNHIKT